jgi:hypothetical protein
MSVIAYNTNDGLAITIPTGELPIEEVLAKDCPAGAVIVDTLPDERDFRNAWELSGKKITVNFSKAQEITKDRLRAERTPLLAAQDVAFQRALESGADTSAIIAEKNRLRDVTGLVDGATELFQLRALTCASTALEPIPVVEEVAPVEGA